MELRDGDEGAAAGAQTIADAVTEAWDFTVWLRQVGNTMLLAEIGSALPGALSDPEVGAASGGVEIRGEEIRGIESAVSSGGAWPI